MEIRREVPNLKCQIFLYVKGLSITGEGFVNKGVDSTKVQENINFRRSEYVVEIFDWKDLLDILCIKKKVLDDIVVRCHDSRLSLHWLQSN